MDHNLKVILQNARDSADIVGTLSIQKRNGVLKSLAEALMKHTSKIMAANAKDFAVLPSNYALADRLWMTEIRIKKMAQTLTLLAKMPDPLGVEREARVMPNKLMIRRVSVPLGVLGIIYEARPDITIEISGLAIKSGNVAVLKGGTDAYHTNVCLVEVMHKVLDEHQLPRSIISIINPKNRQLVRQMLRANDFIDVIIPRGGQSLIEYVRENASVPIIETGAGVCHIYVHRNANLEWAKNSVINAKLRRPSVCNALDTLLVDREVAEVLLKAVADSLIADSVLIHADERSFSILKHIYPQHLLTKATKSDFGKEFLGYEMAIKVVRGSQEAMKHIARYGSRHSEAIMTDNNDVAEDFVNHIDAAAVYINAPTSFTDGFEFGLGAEVGISTQKLHARGPMGLEALTSSKWIIRGQGQVRSV